MSVLTDHIVEIGAVDAQGVVFTTIVNPLVTSSGPAVHGISDSELLEGPTLGDAFPRLVYFLESLADNALSLDEGDSSLELPGEPTLPHMKTEIPDIVVVAHNGIKFDFPFLLSECFRCNLALGFFAKLKYVDSLSIVRAMDARVYGGCMKLQCMLLHLHECGGGGASLRAHRALDDAIVLKDVVGNLAYRLGVPTHALLSNFSCELDLRASVAQLSSIV